MTEPFDGTLADIVFNPEGSLSATGQPVWYCSAHSRRKKFPQLELGEAVLTLSQFQTYHPDGFRNSMAAVIACKKIVTTLLESGELYYQGEPFTA